MQRLFEILLGIILLLSISVGIMLDDPDFMSFFRDIAPPEIGETITQEEILGLVILSSVSSATLLFLSFFARTVGCLKRSLAFIAHRIKVDLPGLTSHDYATSAAPSSHTTNEDYPRRPKRFSSIMDMISQIDEEVNHKMARRRSQNTRTRFADPVHDSLDDDDNDPFLDTPAAPDTSPKGPILSQIQIARHDFP